MRAGLAVILAVVVAAIPAAGAVAAEERADAGRVEAYLAQVRNNPQRLHAFLQDLPKGGDLHTHLSGAVSTETLIRLGASGGQCINVVTFVAATGPCVAGQRPAADAETDQAFRTQVIAAWSMEGFQPGQGESGHDHFFNTFGKFGSITGVPANRPEMLAQVIDKAARQNELYMESMLTRQGSLVSALAQRVTFDPAAPDFTAMLAQVLAGDDLDRIVAAARAETDVDEAAVHSLLRCGTPVAAKGCAMTVRYMNQVSRNSAPNVVFTQMVYGFELATADQRTVGLNMVQPEDGAVSLRDYSLHMRMLNYLRGIYPAGHISLHAGELVPGLVPDADLRFHIREAVLIGQAERIGHGVDIRYEDDWPSTMRIMARRGIAAEIQLTSNEQILGVSGRDHPFPTYRALGVPTVLNTDDEGVSRSDLTGDYRRAVTTYHLTYLDLKQISRAALEHAFLDAATRQTLLHQLELMFKAFEHQYGSVAA